MKSFYVARDPERSRKNRKEEEGFHWSYHGAKNLIKTVFPAVADSQLEGLRLSTSAFATPAIAESIRMVLVAIFILAFVWLL